MPSALKPNTACYVSVKGLNKIDHTQTIIESGSQIVVSESISDVDAAETWYLTRRHIRRMRKEGLQVALEFLFLANRLGFCGDVQNAFFIFARTAFTKDPIEKVVFAISALESVFVKNEQESIQHNLAERIAFLLYKKGPDRKMTIQNIKKAYKLRSRHLHHGKRTANEETVFRLLQYAQWCFIRLMSDCGTWKTKDDFCSQLDDKKLGLAD